MNPVERLNTLLESMDDCRIESFDGKTLLVIGDWDLGYHHGFEAAFQEVTFTQCPTYFNAESFRIATQEEKRSLQLANWLNENDEIYCFESDGKCFFIAAHALEVREERVLHYTPES
jgi:hypothetical protein